MNYRPRTAAHSPESTRIPPLYLSPRIRISLLPQKHGEGDRVWRWASQNVEVIGFVWMPAICSDL